MPMLNFVPSKRATAGQMLQHPWLRGEAAAPAAAAPAAAAAAPAAHTGRRSLERQGKQRSNERSRSRSRSPKRSRLVPLLLPAVLCAAASAVPVPRCLLPGRVRGRAAAPLGGGGTPTPPAARTGPPAPT